MAYMPPKPVLLCLHGAGSSAAIFRVQSYMLAKALAPYFDLVYVDAPCHSRPGPGILPLFADSGPYWRWFRPTRHDQAGARGADGSRLIELLEIRQWVSARIRAQGVCSTDVVGIVGFSQGAMAAMALLGLQIGTGSREWTSLRFCVMMGAATGDGHGGNVLKSASSELSALTKSSGSHLFPGFTCHVVGTHDEWASEGRQIAAQCEPKRSRLMEFEGGHAVPSMPEDVRKLVMQIMKTSEDSRAAG